MKFIFRRFQRRGVVRVLARFAPGLTDADQRPALPQASALRSNDGLVWLLSSLAIAVLLPALRAGALVWEKETIVADAEPSAERFQTEFRFRNASDHAVTLTSIDPGCRCTVADVEKKTYSPGESGVLPVVFTFGDQRGPQEKSVFVQTDEGGAPPMQLVLRINITELAVLEPMWAVWRAGAEPTEKTLLCRATTDKAVTVVAAEASDPGFVTRIETVESGRRYRIVVKPAATQQARSATLAIKTIVPDAGERTYKAFVAVRE